MPLRIAQMKKVNVLSQSEAYVQFAEKRLLVLSLEYESFIQRRNEACRHTTALVVFKIFVVVVVFVVFLFVFVFRLPKLSANVCMSGEHTCVYMLRVCESNVLLQSFFLKSFICIYLKKKKKKKNPLLLPSVSHVCLSAVYLQEQTHLMDFALCFLLQESRCGRKIA